MKRTVTAAIATIGLAAVPSAVQAANNNPANPAVALTMSATQASPGSEVTGTASFTPPARVPNGGWSADVELLPRGTVLGELVYSGADPSCRVIEAGRFLTCSIRNSAPYSIPFTVKVKPEAPAGVWKVWVLSYTDDSGGGPNGATSDLEIVESQVVPPASEVTARAVSRAGKLFVDVNPNKGRGFWRFTVYRLKPDGSTWAKLKTYKTQGPRETRTLNLKKGTYRVVVLPKYNLASSTSQPVRLRR
jgi:hypothetical protein